MTHIALYRKYRPQTFDQVKGQKSVVQYLQSLVVSQKIPHALIFTGGRGTGKTTLARIFAKEIGVHSHDIYEIDAASYNGVDEIRQLREDSLTLPLSSQYKIYILDEVHMLSKSAWNAFLKILEEPPAHVLFFMATTELHKIIPTVLSRCQVIQLDRPTKEILVDQIIDIADQEGKKLSHDLAMVIANRAQGSFRDALVLLEQILEQSSGTTILESDIEKIGLRSFDHMVFDFLELLDQKNQEKLFTLVQSVAQSYEKGMSDFLEKLIHTVRLVLFMQHAPVLWEKEKNQFSNDEIVLMQKYQLSFIGSPDFLRKLIGVYQETGQSTFPEIPLELAIIEILSNTTNVK